MAVKGARRRRARREKNSAEESASEARLTPLEEISGGAERSKQHASQNDGTLVLNTGQLKLPQDFKEEEEASGFPRIDPALLVILCFSLIFIAVIAYIIWNGWEPPK